MVRYVFAALLLAGIAGAFFYVRNTPAYVLIGDAAMKDAADLPKFMQRCVDDRIIAFAENRPPPFMLHATAETVGSIARRSCICHADGLEVAFSSDDGYLDLARANLLASVVAEHEEQMKQVGFYIVRKAAHGRKSSNVRKALNSGLDDLRRYLVTQCPEFKDI